VLSRSELYYTASGINTPVGGRPVRSLREEIVALSWLIAMIIVFVVLLLCLILMNIEIISVHLGCTAGLPY